MRLSSQIHKTIAELPLNARELAEILYADEADVRAALVLLRNQGFIKTDNQGRYTASQSLDADTIKLRRMIAKLEASNNQRHGSGYKSKQNLA